MMRWAKRNCFERQSKVSEKKVEIGNCFVNRLIELCKFAESNLQPYYDDEREPICDTEDDDDSSGDEIVMVHRGGGIVPRGDDSDSN